MYSYNKDALSRLHLQVLIRVGADFCRAASLPGPEFATPELEYHKKSSKSQSARN